MEIKDSLLKEFAEVYGDAEGVRVFFAPGRVNLIGEHTDYTAGMYFHVRLQLEHMQQLGRGKIENLGFIP